MNGYLLINKPKEWTSFDVVNKIRGQIQNSEYNSTNKKRFPVGHTGTLDPLATGLMVILIGKYTKKSDSLLKSDKTYIAKIKLGEESSTGDEEGEKTQISNTQPTADNIKNIIRSFIGDITQTPPIFSAIKINGKKAYELARQGKKVEIKPREVHIYDIEILSYIYPEIEIKTKVSSGTYIRTLAEDIGKKLGTGAYMSDLRRTQIGSFKLEQSITLEDIDIQKIKNNLQTLD
jgi:tRNA pseudouridine55 synthase